MSEYKKGKVVFGTRDRSSEVKTSSRMPTASPETMESERIRSKLRYKTTPSQKAKNKLGKEYM